MADQTSEPAVCVASSLALGNDHHMSWNSPWKGIDVLLRLTMSGTRLSYWQWGNRKQKDSEDGTLMGPWQKNGDDQFRVLSDALQVRSE